MNFRKKSIVIFLSCTVVVNVYALNVFAINVGNNKNIKVPKNTYTDKAIKKSLESGSVDLEQIKSLAPFASKESISKVIEKSLEADSVDLEQIKSLAPFASTESIGKTIEKVTVNKNFKDLDLENITSLSYFTTRDYIDRSLKNVVCKTKVLVDENNKIQPMTKNIKIEKEGLLRIDVDIDSDKTDNYGYLKFIMTNSKNKKINNSSYSHDFTQLYVVYPGTWTYTIDNNSNNKMNGSLKLKATLYSE